MAGTNDPAQVTGIPGTTGGGASTSANLNLVNGIITGSDTIVANTLPGAPAEPSLASTFALGDRPWAMTRPALNQLVAQASHPDLAAIAARMSQPTVDGTDVPNYNGTALVEVRGPLFPYRSIFTWLLGGTALEEVTADLQAALTDSAVRAIVLNVNSPGGQIDGINELANKIRAANSIKPVTAYVSGLAGSGAYWLAAAAGRIVADETAQLGSIGVLATVFDDRAAEERHGIKRYEIVSSQSPLKRSDPSTTEGRAQLQDMVDALADVFIEKMAKFRGTSAARVESDFGRGATLPARSAVAAGMADALGSLEGLLSGGEAATIREIRDKPGMRVAVVGRDGVAVWQTPQAQTFDEQELEDETEGQDLNSDANCVCPPGTECQCGEEEDNESEGTEQEPDESSIPKGEGDLKQPTEERQRIAAILTCEEAKGREELARTLALETDHTIEAAKKLLSAAPLASKTNALETRMGQIANPKVGVPADAAEEDSPATEVHRILAFVPKNRLREHVRVQ